MAPQENSIMKNTQSVFTNLSHEIPLTIKDLVEKTGLHHITVRGYLELIEFIQTQPKLILERTGHSYQAKLEGNK